MKIFNRYSETESGSCLMAEPCDLQPLNSNLFSQNVKFQGTDYEDKKDQRDRKKDHSEKQKQSAYRRLKSKGKHPIAFAVMFCHIGLLCLFGLSGVR